MSGGCAQISSAHLFRSNLNILTCKRTVTPSGFNTILGGLLTTTPCFFFFVGSSCCEGMSLGQIGDTCHVVFGFDKAYLSIVCRTKGLFVLLNNKVLRVTCLK